MRTTGYEVRDYPPDLEVISVDYTRRDEAYERLGREWSDNWGGGEGFKPSVVTVGGGGEKRMEWGARWGEGEEGGWGRVACRVVRDALTEGTVRRETQILIEELKRDGVGVREEGGVRFAQYDEVFKMGGRYGEVWVTVEDDRWG